MESGRQSSPAGGQCGGASAGAGSGSTAGHEMVTVAVVRKLETCRRRPKVVALGLKMFERGQQTGDKGGRGSGDGGGGR